MSLIYILIAKKTSILCEYTEHHGNFEQITSQLLRKVTPENQAIFCYESKYYFHYINQSGITHMCMREPDFPSDVADAFLEDIKHHFLAMYQSSMDDSTPLAYSLNESFKETLKERLGYFNLNKSNPSDVLIERLKHGIVETKNAVIDTADVLSMRGGKVDLIVKKADDLARGSVSFHSSARRVKKNQQLRNIGIGLAIVVVLLIIAYLISVVVCGGMDWAGCREEEESQ